MSALDGWQNFYVIVGSAAGALIGLQFVVLTLIAERPIYRMAEAGAAFSTPTIVHFGVVLFLSAVISAPWQGIGGISGILAGVGIAGMLYIALVTRRLRAQSVYLPVFEDWLFHTLLPLAAYAMLVGSAFMAEEHAPVAFFLVSLSVLVLLFVGIHNAWDAVTYHVYRSREQSEKEAEPSDDRSSASGGPAT